MSGTQHIVADIGGTTAHFTCIEAGATRLYGIALPPGAEFTVASATLGN